MRVGPRRNLTMPGVGVTVGEQIEALERIAGAEVGKLIREVPDETIWAIVKGWPTRFEARRSRDLGFAPRRVSTRSSAPISRTSWAERFRLSRSIRFIGCQTLPVRLADSSSRPTRKTKAAPPISTSRGCGCPCGRRRRNTTAQFLAVTASVASAETVIAVPSAMASTDSMPPSPQAVEEGEAQHDQRAGAGADADGGHRRPGGAPVEAIAGQQCRIGRMRMAAGLADLAGAMMRGRVIMARVIVADARAHGHDAVVVVHMRRARNAHARGRGAAWECAWACEWPACEWPPWEWPACEWPACAADRL